MKLNFAPISAGESGYADLAAYYFIGSAFFRALLTGALVAGALVVQSRARHVPARFDSLLFLLALIGCSVATGEFFAGRLIARRRRMGAALAAVVTVFPIPASLALGRWPSVGSVVWFLISAGVLATIWRELR